MPDPRSPARPEDDLFAPRWRPLTNGEYPPPGKTKLGEPQRSVSGNMVRPILVFAAPVRCWYGGEGERCLLPHGHEGRHKVEVRMER